MYIHIYIYIYIYILSINKGSIHFNLFENFNFSPNYFISPIQKDINLSTHYPLILGNIKTKISNLISKLFLFELIFR